VNKGVMRDALNRRQEAITVYDEVVKRYGESTEPALRELVAQALINKGITLSVLNRSEEAITVYDEVVKRYGESTEPALRNAVGTALNNIGLELMIHAKTCLLKNDKCSAKEHLKRAQESICAAIDLDPHDAIKLVHQA